MDIKINEVEGKLVIQDCYTSNAMKGSSLYLKLQQWVEERNIEKHTDKYLLSKQELTELIEKVCNDALTQGHYSFLHPDICPPESHESWTKTYIDNLFK